MRSDRNIFQFIGKHIASNDEWTEYLRVKDAEAPKGRSNQEVMKFTLYPETALPIATDEYRSKFELEKKFRAALREVMIGEEWIAEGKNRGSVEDTHIRRDFWNRSNIEILDNKLTSNMCDFADIKIFKVKWSKREELTNFIEKCTSVLPSDSVRKDDIRGLAIVLLDRNVSGSTFQRAWDDAELTEDWTAAGRRQALRKNKNSIV